MANKKYLDEVGLAYLINMLDNYPDNELLATVISAIQDALNDKNVDLGLTVDAQGYICQTMEVDNNAGSN